MAGYSGTPLVRKLGIVDQPRLVVLGAPWDYESTIGLNVGRHNITSRLGKSELFVHAFLRGRTELDRLGKIDSSLADTGMVWISWPKKSSGLATDLNEELVRQAGLKAGLVDVKVCAVDATWSGLKFVRRLKDRKQ